MRAAQVNLIYTSVYNNVEKMFFFFSISFSNFSFFFFDYRYTIYHCMFKLTPTLLRDWLSIQFVNMPKYEQ